MKKASVYFAVTVLLILGIQLTGCRKLFDQYFPGHHGGSGNCSIVQIKTRISVGPDIYTTGNFTYDNNGQPLTVIFDSLYNITPWHYFVYDQQGRLREYKTKWGAGVDDYIEWHKYGYSGSGLIVVDTAYLRIEGDFVVISDLEYDNKDRIVEEVESILQEDGTTVYFRTENFEYDSRGNLVAEGRTYDDGKNFLQTNDVWPFIERNYSRNNIAGGTVHYNASGFPLGFDESFSNTGLSFLGMSEPREIKYSCGGH